MSMWLQTRTVRHLVNTTETVHAICGATPRMWFDKPPGRGVFVFDRPPHGIAPVDFDLPICAKCVKVLEQLTRDNR